jgi:hypothetical protein
MEIKQVRQISFSGVNRYKWWPSIIHNGYRLITWFKSKWMEVSSHSLPVTMAGSAMFLLNYTLWTYTIWYFSFQSLIRNLNSIKSISIFWPCYEPFFFAVVALLVSLVPALLLSFTNFKDKSKQSHKISHNKSYAVHAHLADIWHKHW